MKHRTKQTIRRLPVVGGLAARVYKRFAHFPGSQRYWEERYAASGDSGDGSMGRLAAFKASVVNSFVADNGVLSVIEFGCGDGLQLALADYPSYIGLDVSPTAIKLCKDRFINDSTKSFFLYDTECFVDHAGVFRADLALSIDVLFHVTEDEVFDSYMAKLFASSERYVVVYSSNFDEQQDFHVKHREFTRWVDSHAADWELVQRIKNPYPYDPHDPKNTSPCDFYIFERRMAKE